MATEQVHEVHGVDVSWLHHSNRDLRHLPRTSSSPARSTTSTRTASPAPPRPTSQHAQSDNKLDATSALLPSSNSNGNAIAGAPTSPNITLTVPAAVKSSRRPGLLRGGSSEKVPSVSGEESKKKSTWMSSLKSKVSSSYSQQQQSQQQQQQQKQQPQPQPPQLQQQQQQSPSSYPSSSSSNTKSRPQPIPQASQSRENLEPPDSPPTARSSSFTRALKRISSNTNANNPPKPSAVESSCPRRTLNVDGFRDRNPIKELDLANLKRVAFNVDVEIAGHSRYTPEDPPVDAEQKRKDKRLQEQSEGAALKQHDSNDSETGKTQPLTKQTSLTAPLTKQTSITSTMSPSKNVRIPSPPKRSDDGWDDPTPDLDLLYSNPRSGSYDEATSRAQAEADEERKRAKEERRRRKEAENEPDDQPPGKTDYFKMMTFQAPPPLPVPKGDRPTTDPLRIYRKCCALREAPVLKRIKEQLERPVNANSAATGLVVHLDLTGSRMQLPDIVCLSDWLAIVPVKQIILENSNLTDEAVRILLAGLSAARSPEVMRRKRARTSGTKPTEADHPGVVEKISFRNNPKLTRKGWKHILLFVTMSRSIRAMDMSQIPFAADDGSGDASNDVDMSDLLYKSLTERLAGAHLEEINLSECALTTNDIHKLTDAISKSGVRRIGLAGNNIDDHGLEHIANFVRQGFCQGLDLSSNNLRGNLNILAEALHSQNKIVLIGLENCNLDSKDLLSILPALPKLTELRGLDFSHNHELFHGAVHGLHVIRRWLPQLPYLKRLHLEDVNMTPQEAIGIAEILPDIRNLCHISILNNPPIKAVSHAVTEEQTEEACAVYASFMAAARLHKTLMAIDIEVPAPETSEVVKALAKQAAAYCIRNMDRFTASEAMNLLDSASVIPDEADDITVPEILAHLVDHDDHTLANAGVGADQDYIVGGTGVVKALQYCLGQKAREGYRNSSAFSSPFGTGSPSLRPAIEDASKAKATSMSLLQSARRIRANIERKLAQESVSGDEMAFRRLQFFDQKVSEMIAQFETEYPETRVQATPIRPEPERKMSKNLIIAVHEDPSEVPVQAEAASDTASTERNSDAGSDSGDDTQLHARSRLNSSASAQSLLLAAEEGDMHRLGQRMRRNVLRPVGTDDHLHHTSTSDAPEPTHLMAFRKRLEEMPSDEIRDMIIRLGFEKTYESFADMADMLKMLAREKPEQFQSLKIAQVQAYYNAGRMSRKQAESEIGAKALDAGLPRPNSSDDESQLVTTI